MISRKITALGDEENRDLVTGSIDQLMCHHFRVMIKLFAFGMSGKNTHETRQ